MTSSIDRSRVGTRGDRRARLVAAAAKLLRTASLDQLQPSLVAREAGVSKALVYYYFPTHRDLQVAVVRAAADELLARIQPDPALPPAERLAVGLDIVISYIEQQPAAYVSIARGAGYNARLLEIFEDARAEIVRIMARELGIDDPPPPVQIAIRGWIAMVEEAVVHWIVTGRTVPRARLVEFLHGTALAMVPRASAMSRS